RNLLRKGRVRQVFHLRQRHAVGAHGQRQDGRVGGIDLAVDRRRRQIVRQIGLRRVDRRLYLLLGDVDVLFQVELQGDDRGSERTAGGHLAQAGQFAKLPLQRRGDGRRGDVGTG